MGVVFDKLDFMRKLEGDGGFGRTQAKRLNDAFCDAVVEGVATKQDVGEVRSELKETRAEVKHEVAELRSEMKHDIAELRSEAAALRGDLRSEVAQLQVWAAGTGAALVSLPSALKFFS